MWRFPVQSLSVLICCWWAVGIASVTAHPQVESSSQLFYAGESHNDTIDQYDFGIFIDQETNGTEETTIDLTTSDVDNIITASTAAQIALEAEDNQTALQSTATEAILAPNLMPLSVSNEYLKNRTATVQGIRIEDVLKGVSYENKGVTVLLADSTALIRLFGERFTKHTIIRFVTEMGSKGSDCDDLTSTKSFPLMRSDLTQHSAVSTIQLPPLDLGEETFYICVRENNTDMPWVHQGTAHWLQLKTYKAVLPIWSHILILILLLLLSGLFSGLNLGLMAMDRTELQILVNTGGDRERRYARKIQPLRDNGNYLLCSLLLGNVLVNSTLTILLDDLTTGIVAIITSTLGIVILGEIVPQAFCSRHGLAVGARTIWMTKFTMALTFPISYPVSVLLDKVLGEEIGNVYNRDRLKELIKVTHQYNDLEKDEVNIIAGALEMKQKTVGHIMTKLEDVFMLPVDAVLDFDTVSEIMSQGYSRIPVFDGDRGNVTSLLYMKDLAFVDPDDKMPLRTICEFYSNPCNFVFETTTLDVIFREFKQGVRGHMAFVQRIASNGSKDPYYEIVGLITMEDVIEELIQAEISDETDVWGWNRRRRSRTAPGGESDLPLIRWKQEGIHVSPQLMLAAFQYLSTSVEHFNNEKISKTILQRLLSQNLFFQIKLKIKDGKRQEVLPSNLLYERGKPADYFVLILEGRVQAVMGRESLIFESGPFTFFGTQSLNQNVGLGEAPSTPAETRKYNPVNVDTVLQSSFVPDYTVRAVSDVTFLRISRSIYMAAKQATLFERTYSVNVANGTDKSGDSLEEQIDKIMTLGYNEKSLSIPDDWITASLRPVNNPIRLGSFRRPREFANRPTGDLLSELILKPQLLMIDYEKDDYLLKRQDSFRSRVNSTTSRVSNATATDDSIISKSSQALPKSPVLCVYETDSGNATDETTTKNTDNVNKSLNLD